MNAHVFPITTPLMWFYVKLFSGYIKIWSISCPLCKEICSIARDRYTSPDGLLLKYYAIISFKIYFLNILTLALLSTSLLWTDKQFLWKLLTHHLLWIKSKTYLEKWWENWWEVYWYQWLACGLLLLKVELESKLTAKAAWSYTVQHSVLLKWKNRDSSFVSISWIQDTSYCCPQRGIKRYF